jgi:hypothetical protein
LLGGGWRLAVYQVAAVPTVTTGRFDAYRALYSDVLPEPQQAVSAELVHDFDNPTACPESGPRPFIAFMVYFVTLSSLGDVMLSEFGMAD